jgi:dihydropteroate synthase
MTSSAAFEMEFRGRRLVRDRALIMAIINRTPDSFYDNGATFADTAAQEGIHQAVAEGADLIDIGGVPASPGPEVEAGEEVRRVVPIIEWARDAYPELVISIDTWSAEVADAACRAGADVVNHSWSTVAPELAEVAAKYGAGYICTHTGVTEPRKRAFPVHYDDVVATVLEDLTRRARHAEAIGVPREGIVIDPTVGVRYGKDTEQSLALVRNVRAFVDTGWPVLMAVSHKGFIGETLDADVPDRLAGTLATTAFAAAEGAAMFRAHQVLETRHTAEMIASITGARSASRPGRWSA